MYLSDVQQRLGNRHVRTFPIKIMFPFLIYLFVDLQFCRTQFISSFHQPRSWLQNLFPANVVHPWADSVWLMSSGCIQPQTHPPVHYQGTWVSGSGACLAARPGLSDMTACRLAVWYRYAIRQRICTALDILS
jgi:hypothetical protein